MSNDAMITAIKNNDPGKLADAIHSGGDPNGLMPDGTPFLLAASAEDDPVLVGILLKQGARVDVSSKHGETPLHLVAARNFHGVAIILLEHNANPNLPNDEGDTALHKATEENSREAVITLLARGADPNAINTKSGFTPLHVAAVSEQPRLINLLLDAGSNPTSKDFDGATPLIVAAQAGAKRAISALLSRGVDVNDADLSNRTALIWVATKYDDPELIELLIQAGADVAAKDSTGHTALSRALLVGHPRSAQLLSALKQ